MEHPIRVALALSGGTAKSVAHIGVIRALEEAGIEVERLAGTSGGAIIAANYAAGISIAQLEDTASRTRLTDLGGLGFRRLGFFSSDKLHKLVSERIGDVRFDQLRTPLGIVVTNLMTGVREVLESGVVARAAQASACIPQIYAPVDIDGSLYVDGGLVEYMPVRALIPHEPTLIVGVNLGFHREVMRPRHMLGVIMQTIGLVGQQNAKISAHYADVVITPNLRQFSAFEIKESEAMIEVGYEATRERLAAIEAAWVEANSVRRRLSRMWKRALYGQNDDPIAPGAPQET